MIDPEQRDKLKMVLNDQADLELAILVGSQVNTTASQDGDWDIAIRWVRSVAPMQRLGKTRHQHHDGIMDI